jgi:mRNA-degrading endonuclease RelE of RelBE toxin-antitoxin system
MLEGHVPEVPDPLYALQYSSGAKKTLADLPFELFERVRDRTVDLSFDPHPSDAKANASRPGSWSVHHENYRIDYFVHDQPRAVSIESVNKR